ncbi:MAG: DUF1476 domain-containing protein [Alphaproteobacteria bacterium]|nr:DUF1476 domain-containing protein [Alphaproteobacteria bacterium]
MTTFDEREKAYEEKFAHDEELRFKAKVKAAKLLAKWAANEIGLSVDVYVNELVNMVTSGSHEDALLDKVAKDAVNKGKNLSKAALAEKYSSCENQAREIILNQ